MNATAFHECQRNADFLGMMRGAFSFEPRQSESTLKRYFGIIGKINDLRSRSALEIAMLKAKFEGCSCVDDVKCACIQESLDKAKGIRDELLVVEQGFSESILLFYHHKLIAELLDDWDELVTDLSISADPEIHRLAADVSNLLSCRS